MGNSGGNEGKRGGLGVDELNENGKRIKGRRVRGSGDTNIRDSRQENEKTEERLRGVKAQRGAGVGGVKIEGRFGDGGVDTVSRSVGGISVKGERNRVEDEKAGEIENIVQVLVRTRGSGRIGRGRTSEEVVGQGDRGADVRQEKKGKGAGRIGGRLGDEGADTVITNKGIISVEDEKPGGIDNVRQVSMTKGSGRMGRGRGRGRTSTEVVEQVDGGADVKQEKKGRGAGAVQERGARGREKGEVGGRGKQIATLTQDEYLQLLKCLKIKLPEGVLNQRVMELVNTESSIQDAEAILKDLESFLIRFKAVPRLACRDVKHHLNLKRDSQILRFTKLLFFEKEDDKERRRKQWRGNTTNTGRGFRLRERYMDTAISTPAMYSTAVTRSRGKLKVGEDSPIATEGTRVNLADVERRDYTDESKLWKNGKPSGAGRTGMFSVNKRDELEMLKFFHELGVVKRGITYSRGNKVEYGFLSGKLDFLVQIKPNSFEKSKTPPAARERLVIECKSTTGDMIGKLFTKIPDSVCAKIDQSHDYSFQVQTYMYILNREAEVKKLLQMKKAVMVVRHYHQGGTPPRDFHWNYLQIDPSIQDQIKELRLLCQEEVLARYLALLNLIFQKETPSS